MFLFLFICHVEFHSIDTLLQPFTFFRYMENSKSARETIKFRWKARSLADAKAMIRLQTNVKLNVLNKGDVVYKEGDMGQSMYFVDEERGGEYSNEKKPTMKFLEEHLS